MKLIRFSIKQPLANYKRPGSMQIKETFPLPPYSTVKGMVHAVCGFKRLVPMDFSIQGRYASKTTEAFIRYEFNSGMKYEAVRHQVKVDCENGDNYGISRGLGKVNLLVDVELLIHLHIHEEKDFEIVLQGLKRPLTYPALGRYEDVVQIEDVQVVEHNPEKMECVEELPYNLYWPYEKHPESEFKTEDVKGTYFTLNKTFDYIGKAPKLRRIWTEKVKAMYVTSEHLEDIGQRLPVDQDGIPVFLA